MDKLVYPNPAAYRDQLLRFSALNHTNYSEVGHCPEIFWPSRKIEFYDQNVIFLGVIVSLLLGENCEYISRFLFHLVDNTFSFVGTFFSRNLMCNNLDAVGS